MKKIVFIIYRGEKKSKLTVKIGDDLFKILTGSFGLGNYDMYNGILSNSTIKDIENMEMRYYDLFYDVMYDILNLKLGLDSDDIDELNSIDVTSDEIEMEVILSE